MAGVCATDPYRSMPQFLQQLKDLGFCGVQNFPTVGLVDGNFRKNLEATGMSYQKEVEMIRIARQMDLLTAPYVFNVDEAERMTKAGADVIVVHLGLTTGGSIGAGEGEITLDYCVETVQTIRDACVKIQPDVIVLCHGGPVSGETCNPLCRWNRLTRCDAKAWKRLATSWTEFMVSMASSVQVVWKDYRQKLLSSRMREALRTSKSGLTRFLHLV